MKSCSLLVLTFWTKYTKHHNDIDGTEKWEWRIGQLCSKWYLYITLSVTTFIRRSLGYELVWMAKLPSLVLIICAWPRSWFACLQCVSTKRLLQQSSWCQNGFFKFVFSYNKFIWISKMIYKRKVFCLDSVVTPEATENLAASGVFDYNFDKVSSAWSGLNKLPITLQIQKLAWLSRQGIIEVPGPGPHSL